METIDQDLPATAMYVSLEVLMVAGIIGTISATLPSFLFAGALICVFYYALGVIYLTSSRELKRFGAFTCLFFSHGQADA